MPISKSVYIWRAIVHQWIVIMDEIKSLLMAASSRCTNYTKVEKYSQTSMINMEFPPNFIQSHNEELNISRDEIEKLQPNPPPSISKLWSADSGGIGVLEY